MVHRQGRDTGRAGGAVSVENCNTSSAQVEN